MPHLSSPTVLEVQVHSDISNDEPSDDIEVFLVIIY
jgi:hypothetical protein